MSQVGVTRSRCGRRLPTAVPVAVTSTSRSTNRWPLRSHSATTCPYLDDVAVTGILRCWFGHRRGSTVRVRRCGARPSRSVSPPATDRRALPYRLPAPSAQRGEHRSNLRSDARNRPHQPAFDRRPSRGPSRRTAHRRTTALGGVRSRPRAAGRRDPPPGAVRRQASTPGVHTLGLCRRRRWHRRPDRHRRRSCVRADARLRPVSR